MKNYEVVLKAMGQEYREQFLVEALTARIMNNCVESCGEHEDCVSCSLGSYIKVEEWLLEEVE